MAKRKSDLKTIDPISFSPKGVGDKVRGGALATQKSRDAALMTQMQVLPRGARVLCRAGIQGQLSMLVADGVSPGPPVQVYPLATAERVMARARVKLTPGYEIQGWALCLPSGPTQDFSTAEWKEGIPNGTIKINATITGSEGSSLVSASYGPNWSTELNKGLPSGAGACFDVLELIGMDITIPEWSETPGWTEGLRADISIIAIGSARPLDIIIYEVPNIAVHDETHREATVPSFPPQMNYQHAITAVSQSTNPTGGSQQANKSLQDLRQVHGPMLMQWTTWNEDLVSITATEGTAIQIIQTFFRDLHSTSIIAHADNNPGWSVSSGAYARNLEQSGPLELRGVNGAIPVIVRVYARMLNAAHVGTVRFQTESYSLRDITVTGSTSFAWYSGLAWIRVPVHASLDSLLQVLAKVNSAGQTLEIRYLSAEYGGHYTVAE